MAAARRDAARQQQASLAAALAKAQKEHESLKAEAVAIGGIDQPRHVPPLGPGVRVGPVVAGEIEFGWTGNFDPSGIYIVGRSSRSQQKTDGGGRHDRDPGGNRVPAVQFVPADVTDEAELRSLFDDGPVTFYVGDIELN